MSQSRRASLIETCVGIAVGFAVSMLITALVFPLYGIPVTLAHNVQITAIYTVASLLRGYCLRRFFNRMHTP